VVSRERSGAEVSEQPAEAGRARQRRRTRKAIVDAATKLIESGRTPSVAEIADAADVSRRTVYLYFPSIEQLLIDATLGALTANAVSAAFAPEELADDVPGRVDALVRALNAMTDDTMALGRSLIRLTVETAPDGDAGAPRRGYRRVEWIEEALAPLRGRASDEQFERLVSALSMITGWEAFIVLRDVRGLDHEAEEAVTRWAAAALVDATLRELDRPASRSRRRS
jgi:AcrR family transcriptional regulator